MCAGETVSVDGPDARTYRACSICGLIYVDRLDHLDAVAERGFYGTHQNRPDDLGYVRFLRQAVDPALVHIRPGVKVLDFGCGPGPALARILEPYGVTVVDYDPYFANIPLAESYDVVFATEVVEHFRDPLEDWRRLVNLVGDGGVLVLMTELCRPEETSFGLANWRYARDPTHLAFYSSQTLQFLSNLFRLEILWTDARRVYVLRRSGTINP